MTSSQTPSYNTGSEKVVNDSFICCILSHGYKGGIISSDTKKVPMDEIERLTGGILDFAIKTKDLLCPSLTD